MALRYSTSVSYGQQMADDQAPDIVYLNADIINNTVGQPRSLPQDPQIRFNENRDTPIIKDSSLYNFSIVRFTMDGAGKDLPLFIPTIQTGIINNPTSDVNLTCYSMTIVSKITYPDIASNTLSISVVSPEAFVMFSPETQNNFVAPKPEVYPYPSAPPWSAIVPYTQNNLVSLGGFDYSATQSSLNQSPPVGPTNNVYWNYVSNKGITAQDVSTRYYWVYTYSWWLQLVNQTFATAQASLAPVFQQLWNAPVGVPITINGIEYVGGWGNTGTAPALVAKPPEIYYNPTTNLFTIYYDQATYGVANDPSRTPISTDLHEANRLFFNENMTGLFTNFVNNYYASIPSAVSPFVGVLTPSSIYISALSNEQIVYSYLGQNALTVGATSYWVMVQDSPSNATLWSPCSNITFTTTLIPVINEQQTEPVKYGSGNLSSRTTPSAFNPVITDISLPVSNAYDWRGFINYTPQGEYRITSFQNGKQEIRQVDISVWWKNRLDGELYPLQMFNLSSVSLKLMFRKKSMSGKG